MDRKKVASILEEIGDLLEIKGENPFKSRAYYGGARIVTSLQQPLAELVKAGRLGEVRGLGKALVEKITILVETDDLPYYRQLRDSVPPGLLEMLKIPGLGPKRVRQLHSELEVASVGELEYACEENRLVALPGFGAKSQAKVLAGIGRWKRYQGRFLRSEALHQALSLQQEMAALPGAERAEIAGSVRRCKETVKDIDLLVATADPKTVMAAFTAGAGVESVLSSGESKSSVLYTGGLQADLRCIEPADFPFAWHHFTGSAEHNTQMRARAKGKGWRLNEYGLFEGEVLLDCDSEAQLFERLGLAYIEPELREGNGEIEAAEQGCLPRLVEEDDLQGVFHVHTTDSDGSGSLEEMAQAAKSQGWSYLGVCDHSRSAHYAGGLDEQRVRDQWLRIDELNAREDGFRIFKGIESDILPDGSLDYPDELLQGFDFVIASVHSHFGLPEKEQTARILKALRHPATTMIGHLTGRLLLARDGYQIDQEAVIDEAGRLGVVLELNANPHRLDLDWRMMRRAREAGVMVAVNPDAHSVAGLLDVAFGIGSARKGWLEAKDILNTRSAGEVERFFTGGSKKG